VLIHRRARCDNFLSMSRALCANYILYVFRIICISSRSIFLSDNESMVSSYSIDGTDRSHPCRYAHPTMHTPNGWYGIHSKSYKSTNGIVKGINKNNGRK
jgi:hypothetical protein